jgi:hypothetical protein
MGRQTYLRVEALESRKADVDEMMVRMARRCEEEQCVARVLSKRSQQSGVDDNHVSESAMPCTTG